MAVPNIFGNVTTTIPLSQLDQNFATPVTIGNTTVGLGNTTSSLGNVTLLNPTITATNVTVTLVGVNANVTGTGTYIVIGDHVTIDVPSLTGTSNAATKTITGFPAAIAPASSKNGLTTVSDNSGGVVVGVTQIGGGSSNISVYATAAAGAWTASGTALINRFSMSYTIK